MIIGQSHRHREAVLPACMQTTVLSLPKPASSLLSNSNGYRCMLGEGSKSCSLFPPGMQNEPIWFTQRILFFPCKGKNLKSAQTGIPKVTLLLLVTLCLLVKQAHDHLRGGLTAMVSGCQSLQPFKLPALLTLPRKQRLPLGRSL